MMRARKRAITGAMVLAVLSLVGACDHGGGSPTGWELSGQDVDLDVIHSYQGEEHCDWQDVTFLQVAWPLGTSGAQGKARMYVRDPERVLAEQSLAEFQSDARLPEDAEFTGYSSEVGELWLAPGDQDTVAYVVTKDGEHVEAWPRTRSLMGCD